MRNIPLTLTMCLISFLGLAQNWAPTGATWYYEIVDPFSPSLTYAKYVSTGDTNILGQNCKIIQQTVGANSYDFLIGRSNTAYTYELNRKIYVYDATNSNFSLLYDFAADSGDTWITTWDTCNYLRTILHTDSILINGNYLKTLSYGGSTIIERIGGVRTLFHGLGEVSCDPPDSIIFEFPFVQRLRCYEDSIIGFYNTGVSSSCDFVTSIDHLKFDSFGSIYPNPASSILNIQLNNKLQTGLMINFYTSMGKLYETANIYKENSTIDISGFEPGVYFLIISDDYGKHWHKKLVINAP